MSVCQFSHKFQRNLNSVTFDGNKEQLTNQSFSFNFILERSNLLDEVEACAMALFSHLAATSHFFLCISQLLYFQ